MQIVRRMGVVDAIRAHATGMDSITAFKLGSGRQVEVDLRPIFTVISDDHVEIMRDDLSEALRTATGGVDVEYLFGRTITELHDGDVILDDGTERRFDIVIGADGLHSNVRHLAFGDEARLTTFLGTYLGVATVPKPSTAGPTFVADLGPNRLIGCYSTAAMSDARLIFLYRPTQELRYDRNDRAAQKQLLRAAYAGFGSRVEGWLDELDRTDVFYLEGISQVVMDTWSRGRVSLIGDAGYCPGPAVGGGTSLAVVGAYVLAGELAQCRGDHARAFVAYETALQPYVIGSRRLGRRIARHLPPARDAGISAIFLGARRLVTHSQPAAPRPRQARPQEHSAARLGRHPGVRGLPEGSRSCPAGPRGRVWSRPWRPSLDPRSAPSLTVSRTTSRRRSTTSSAGASSGRCRTGSTSSAPGTGIGATA